MKPRLAISDSREASYVFIAYWILFPGFFFYHFLVGADLLVPVLGGFFTPITIACALFFWLPASQQTVLSSRTAALIVPFVAFMVLVAMTALLGIACRVPDRESSAVFEQTAKFLLQTAVVFYLGSRISLRAAWRFRVMLGTFLAIVAIAGMNFAQEDWRFTYLADATDPERVASYQGMARSVFCTAVLVIAYMRPLVGKVLIVLVTTMLLFAIGARSEFVGVLIVMGLIVLQRGISAIGITILALSGLIAIIQADLSPLADHRVLRLFHLGADTSYAGRQAMLSDGWRALQDGFVLGDYGGQVGLTGQVGAYMHNLLSAWRQFGIVGFLTYGWLQVYCAIVAWNCYRRHRSREAEAAVFFTWISLVLSLATKSVFWFVPALGWGLVLGLLQAEEHRAVLRHQQGYPGILEQV